MLKGISMAARAMKNQTVRNDVIASNLANVNTAGFKKDIAVFDAAAAGEGGDETAVVITTSYEQGPLVRTDRPLDLAIQGDGYFVIDTDEGDRFTRRGSFVQDENGALVTHE